MSASLKQSSILVVKIIGLTFILMILSGIGSKMLPAAVTGGGGAEGGEAVAASQPAAEPSGSFLAVVLTIMLLQVVALAFPIVRSRWSGWRLAATIFVVYFGTVTFMSQIESLVYLGGKLPEGFVSGLFAMGLFIAAVFAPVAVVTLGKWKASPSPGEDSSSRPDLAPDLAPDLGRWAWRVAAAGVVFLALYYLFGYYVAWKNPELRAYYGGSDPGSFLAQMSSVVQATPWMLPLQFVRGLLWVGLGLLVIRSMKGAWWQAGLATALLFAVPSLYLLFPNPIMPDVVRTMHLVETLPYQFLFGWFLAWFLRGRTSPVGEVATAAA